MLNGRGYGEGGVRGHVPLEAAPVKAFLFSRTRDDMVGSIPLVQVRLRESETGFALLPTS